MMAWLLFLDDIGIVVGDIDGGLYAKVFQFTAVQGLPVFILERRGIVVVGAVDCTASVR
jgi:hypothetical protein